MQAMLSWQSNSPDSEMKHFFSLKFITESFKKEQTWLAGAVAAYGTLVAGVVAAETAGVALYIMGTISGREPWKQWKVGGVLW